MTRTRMHTIGERDEGKASYKSKNSCKVAGSNRAGRHWAGI